MHYLSSVYFVIQPVHVSGIFVAHHEEVYCIYIYIYIHTHTHTQVVTHMTLNTHQYGFTPQKGTTDAAMEIKNYVMEGLAGGEVIALISLDVKGAFDVTFWPSILNGLRACGCPKNLYNLTKSYFSNRTAILSFNSIQIEKEVSRGCPQGSCCGPGYWEHPI
jgi:hypothetical protein